MMSNEQTIGAALQKGRAALFSRRIDEALEIAKDVTTRHSARSEGWHFMGVVLLVRRDMQGAKRSLERAIKIDPNRIEAHLDYTSALLADGETEASLIALRRAMSIETDSARLLNAIGVMCSQCELHNDAVGLFERATQAEQNSEYFYNLAAAQRMLGNFVDAEAAADQAITLEPLACRAHFLRSNLRKQTQERNHISELNQLIATAKVNWRGATLLNYAAAKENEDLGDFKQAFNHLKSAGELQRKNTRYEVSGDVQTIDTLIETFNQKIQNTGYSSNAPIFVFGLPRTGTTLVERIIGSHSQVISHGELAVLSVEIQRMISQQSQSPINKIDMVKRSANLDLEALGKSYVEKAHVPDGEHSRFVDKMPLNYLYAGLIQGALPNAKMVLLKRHPMDACYAIFKMYFEGVYPFSYTLEDLGQYYVAYHRLMEHWKRVLGDSLLEVEYEQIVADQESQTRRILQYCELPWEDQCLNFHENEAASTTASAVQVRSPIYSSSLERWKNIEEELRPLSDHLKANGIHI